MTLQTRAQEIKARLLAHFENPTTELNYSNVYELLVAVILSAQCTDKRVNMITPALFAAYPTLQSLASASLETLKGYIQSISYPNNKAKHLINMAQMVCQRFHGEIPSTQAELKSLPGVGQKSANVVLSVFFEQNYLAVDTHVFRVTHRLGLSNAKTPLQTEQEISALFQEDLAQLHHAFIFLGRTLCKARKPRCAVCFLADICENKNIEL
ncbi:endonuclease III [Helicobacter salomonis]|uniref:endonuclease III n=1 Tax=Helicobacter salomonis TaxID=56878 RepID=UPI000CF1A600|nr:endonuclease III [Helicobacter salomonis]